MKEIIRSRVSYKLASTLNWVYLEGRGATQNRKEEKLNVVMACSGARSLTSGRRHKNVQRRHLGWRGEKVRLFLPK